MSFATGDTVIHPHHGAVEVLAKTTRVIQGVKKKYRPLRTDRGLRVMLPAGTLDEHGIRECMSKKEMKAVLSVISSDPGDKKGSWSRRYKQAREKMTSGDPMIVAEVVRDLGAKDAEKGLSFAQRRLFRNARRVLQGEFAVIAGSEEKAEALVDDALATHAVPEEAAA